MLYTGLSCVDIGTLSMQRRSYIYDVGDVDWELGDTIITIILSTLFPPPDFFNPKTPPGPKAHTAGQVYFM